MYVLPFDHGVASVGLVLRRGEDLPPDEVFEKRPLQIFRRLVQRYPDLKRAFEGARPTLPLVFQPQLAHRRRRAVVKNGWLLPHTFAFFDPLFSTGMAWSLIAVERLAQLLEGEHGSAEEYQRLLDREASQLARLIEAAHLSMQDFRLFRAICGLYFITVSFAEAQQRLLREEADRPLAWQGFLGAGEHRLERIFQRTLEVLRRGRSRGFSTAEVEEFDQWLDLELRPFDLVGFRISERNNLHPVDLDLLIERAHLLGMSRREMMAGVKRLRGQAESLQRWQPGQ